MLITRLTVLCSEKCVQQISFQRAKACVPWRPNALLHHVPLYTKRLPKFRTPENVLRSKRFLGRGETDAKSNNPTDFCRVVVKLVVLKSRAPECATAQFMAKPNHEHSCSIHATVRLQFIVKTIVCLCKQWFLHGTPDGNRTHN